MICVFEFVVYRFMDRFETLFYFKIVSQKCELSTNFQNCILNMLCFNYIMRICSLIKDIAINHLIVLKNRHS